MGQYCEKCEPPLDDECSIFCSRCECKLSDTDKILLKLLRESAKSQKSSDVLNYKIMVLGVGTFVFATLTLLVTIKPLPDSLPDWVKYGFMFGVLIFYCVVGYYLTKNS